MIPFHWPTGHTALWTLLGVVTLALVAWYVARTFKNESED